jgi:tight adherence protein B
MNLSPELTKLIFVIFAALAIGGLAVGLLFPYFTGQADVNRRAKKMASGNLSSGKGKAAGKDKTAARSKRIQETLKEFEEAEKKRRKRLTLRQLINQAGLELDIKVFIIASIVVGAVLFLLTLVIAGVPFLCGGSGRRGWRAGLAALVHQLSGKAPPREISA